MDVRRKLSKKKAKFREIARIPETIDAFLQTTFKAGLDLRDTTYDTDQLTTQYGYKYLMKKYKSKCMIPGILYYFFSNAPALSHYGSFKTVPRDPNIVFNPQKFPGNGTLELEYWFEHDHYDAWNIESPLKNCIDAGVSAIFIPLTLVFKNKQNQHANMLIYRPFNRTVELFEPQFQPAEGENNAKLLNEKLKNFFENELKLGEYVPKYSVYIPVCPNTRQSFQTLDESFNEKRVDEGIGYCQMWCLFIMECILIEPELSTNVIVKKCFDVAETEAGPAFFRILMRGYVYIMSRGTETAYGANLKRKGDPLTRPKRIAILRNALYLAALYKKRSLRTTKKEGSASSHSSDFQDSVASSGLSLTSD